MHGIGGCKWLLVTSRQINPNVTADSGLVYPMRSTWDSCITDEAVPSTHRQILPPNGNMTHLQTNTKMDILCQGECVPSFTNESGLSQPCFFYILRWPLFQFFFLFRHILPFQHGLKHQFIRDRQSNSSPGRQCCLFTPREVTTTVPLHINISDEREHLMAACTTAWATHKHRIETQ